MDDSKKLMYFFYLQQVLNLSSQPYVCLTRKHELTLKVPGGGLLLPLADRARTECQTVVHERKRVALEWNQRSRVTAILASHTLGHGLLVFPFLCRCCGAPSTTEVDGFPLNDED